jgi:hypothetical protein
MDEVLNPSQVKPKSSSVEFEVPFDVIKLPSGGKVYKGTTLEGRDSLEVQYLTATQEDIMTSPNLIDSGRMLDVLLRSVVRDKSVNTDELTISDRNTIVVWLRATGYGAEYPAIIKCENCGQNHKNEFDLNNLETRELEVEPSESGLFEFMLPVSKKVVKFRFMTCADENELENKVKSRNKALGGAVDATMSMRVAQQIQEVDGQTSDEYIYRFVSTLLSADSRAFRKYSASIEPGLDMEQDSECPSCGHVAKEVIPIRANFFWPDSEA